MRRAAAILLAPGLLVLTAGAFAATEALKLRKPPLTIADDGFRAAAPFSPVCDCPSATAEIRLRVRTRQPLQADVLTAGGAVVRRIAQRPSAQGLQRLRWDGRDADGRVVSDGVYHLRLRLGDRTFDIPNEIRVDTEPPEVAATLSRRVISPDGDGRRDAAVVTYTVNEPVRRPADLPRFARGGQVPAIRLDVAPRGGEAVAALVYKPRRTGRLRVPPPGPRRLPVGTAELTLVVTDRAGNVGRSPLGTLRTRYVELVPPATATPAGRPVRVALSTDVPAVRFTVDRAGRTVATGRARPPTLRIPAAATRDAGVEVVRARYSVGPPREQRRYLGEALIALRGRPPAGVALVLPAQPDVAALAPWLEAMDGGRYDGLTAEDARSPELLTGYRTLVLPPGAQLEASVAAVVAQAGVTVVRDLAGARRAVGS